MIVLQILGSILLILLYIILGILALLFLLSLIPLTLDIKTKDGLKLKAKIAFVTINLVPKKEKPLKLSDFKIKHFRKKRLKEERKYLKKKLLSEAKAKRKAELEQSADTDTEKEQKSLKDNAAYALDLMNNVISKALKKFGKHLKIKLYHLRVTVSGSEPDKTALTYGYVCQSVSYLTKLLDSHMNVKYPGKTEKRIYVGVDFVSGKTYIDAHVSLKIRVWQLLSVGVTALIGYLTMPKREKKTEAHKFS